MFLFLLPWRLPQVNRNNQNLWSSLNVGIFHQTWRATQFSHSLEGGGELRAESSLQSLNICYNSVDMALWPLPGYRLSHHPEADIEILFRWKYWLMTDTDWHWLYLWETNKRESHKVTEESFLIKMVSDCHQLFLTRD